MRSPVRTAIDSALKPARLRLAASGVCNGLEVKLSHADGHRDEQHTGSVRHVEM